MLGDTARIRALARGLRERADEIRTLADRLAVRADSVAWDGLAADAMRHHAHDRVTALRRTALLHDDAAEALDRHAGRVDHVTALVKDLAEDLVDGAVEGAGSALSAVGIG